jgi:uncharacterized protein YbbC (DUF1343 family)
MPGFLIYFLILIFLSSCNLEKTTAGQSIAPITKSANKNKIVPGAEKLATYFPLIKGKKVGLVVNQTSIVRNRHIVDTLISIGVDVQKIFAPEHGFRGEADAGELIKDSADPVTGIPLISLYGAKKKPATTDIQGLDVVIFDIQDVGVRFYTYISTLHYVMESCAENNLPLIVLDRPNPNAHYIDGPVLKKEFTSFVGMHPVPVVYGMTIGEYAKMINGEKWLKDGIQCDVTVISCDNYRHDMFYDLPVKPSPNLPNARSVLLYPSLCFFEGTTVSVGRGTEKQFQVVGHPSLSSTYFFVPAPNLGAKTPLHQGKNCYGADLTSITIQNLLDEKKLNLNYLIQYYREITTKGEIFFLENLFFDKLAGTDSLRKMLIAEKNEKDIRSSWSTDLETFKKTRKKYLLYE